MYRILAIDDDQAILNHIEVLLMQRKGFETRCLQNSSKAMDVITEFRPEVVLLDMDMPDVTGLDILKYLSEKSDAPEVLILSGVEDVELAVKAIKLGAYDYLTKPVEPEKLFTSISRTLDQRNLRSEIQNSKENCLTSSENRSFSKIVTRAPEMQKILRYIARIAPTDNPVLIWGESGTGKELLAQALHKLSSRREYKFMAVNAGVFASELFASEFFGHTKGAFTGADHDKEGILEKAEGGTLFLDEIGELSLPIQVKLLRVLQEGEFFRVGSTKSMKANVRLITATNKDLQKEIQQGNFRADLFYRLNVFSVFVPPLRDREGDIHLLAQYFIEKHAEMYGKKVEGISEDVLNLLHRYRYPGNVRELENIINSAVLLETGKELTRRSLPQYFLEATLKGHKNSNSSPEKTMAEMEKEYIERVLKYTHGNRSAASRILNISRVSLISKIKQYNADF
ncbi:MAG: Transcriptional regulatory protein ZraR [Syntrophus sp. PtaB.Bin001]|nr:MAG: Transcriptional regulatory protein ZraR [Syntrophus sp. PtaB.Bin001]